MKALLRHLPLIALFLVGSCGGGGQPDVVVVVVDTLRADRLPMYGFEEGYTPYLDSWAERSVVFERAWSASSWTAPSTASIFTSVYPPQHGVTTGLKLYEEIKAGQNPEIVLNRIPDAIETLPTFMAARGYATFGITDNPNIQEREGFARGFGRFRNFDYKGAEEVNRVLFKWLDEIRSSAPWFVYLHYMDPHAPYFPRAPWHEPVAGGKEAKALAAYDSEISYLDHHLERAFEALGVDEETVVIFTSDHGEEFGEHGSMGHEFKLYSELTHVPLFVHHPGVTPTRQRVPNNVSTLDVLPTLRAILDAPSSEQDEGVPLTRYYLGELPPDDRHVYSMRSRLKSRGGQMKRAVVHGELKYIWTLTKEREQLQELYDLGSDWAESDDRSASRPEDTKRLHLEWQAYEEGLRRWEQASDVFTASADEIDTLEALGYGQGRDD